LAKANEEVVFPSPIGRRKKQRGIEFRIFHLTLLMNDTSTPIVLCADDYGASTAISRGIVQLGVAGRLSATSAMVLSPHWATQARWLDACRAQLDVGLHLDFTSQFAMDAGHGLPLGKAMLRAVLGGFDPIAARDVIERQLDAFENIWGVPPDHVDGHQHVQQFAGIREPLVEVLVRRYGKRAPWLRVSRAPVGQRGMKSRLMAWMGADALTKKAAQAHLPTAPALSGIYNFGGDEAAYAQRMAGWLNGIAAGTLLMCHPGMVADAADNDSIAAARQREFAFLGSDAFAQQLVSARVRLVRGSTLYPLLG
jgi:predicted glycoside hydrolase/deacetylase ChbG (UPF0249 family)